MAKTIVANVEPWETRVAVLDDSVLTGISIERGEPLAGNIYKGRVANVLRGMEAAFIDIGLDRNAFLHVGDVRTQRIGGEEVEDPLGAGEISERLRAGQEVIVQVTKEPMGTKGARVTTFVALPAHYLVLMPTVSYVGVSRRIGSDAERKRLRQIADRIRPDGMGVIVRTAAEGVGEDELAADVRFLLSVWQRVVERGRAAKAPALLYQDLRLIRRIVRDMFTVDVQRFVIDSAQEHQRVLDLLGSFAPQLRERVELYAGAEPVFEAMGIERELEKALRRKVWLKSGGYIVIDRTEALTVIDVNTGKYVGKTDLASTILRTNLEAAGEIVRQVILRDIGGIILVDFIDMESEKHRKRVLQALNEAVRQDRSKFHIIDLTQLGLVEITRKRVYQDLEEVMRIPCPYCEGRGRVLSPEAMAGRVRREIARLARTARARAVLVEVHPDVAARLLEDGGWLRELARQSGKVLRVVGREGMHLERLSVIEGGSAEELEREDVVASRRKERLVWHEHVRDVLDVTRGDGEEVAAVASERDRGGIVRRLLRVIGISGETSPAR